MTDLGVTMNNIPMGIDSHSTPRNNENPTSFGRTKYLEIIHNFKREAVMTEKDIQEGYSKCKRSKLVWVASKDQIGDTFTKILRGNVLDFLSECTGLKN